MCERTYCRHEHERLCSCPPVTCRDALGMAAHLAENMEQVQWSLTYNSLKDIKPYQLCLVGKCRICGGRLCMEQRTVEADSTDGFLAAVYRHLYHFHRSIGQCLPRAAFRTKFVEMFRKEDCAAVEDWLSMPENQSIHAMICGNAKRVYIVLLDEIFKCNDGVLNSLLTALNERKYTNEGRTYPIPVISFFAASNEIPNFNDPQEKILEALYDRLELKVVTANMEDRDTRLAVLKNKQAGTFGQVTVTITLEELRQMQQEVASIPVPDVINELADDILCELRKDMAVSDRKYLGYYPIAQAKAWLSGHDKVESCDLLALKNYLWRLPSDREKVEAVLTRLCVNPMQDKVNNIRGMALESQEEFDAALGDGSKADTVRKAFIKLRGELTHLYQMQCSLRTAAQSDSEIALVDDLLADLERISRKAHEQTHFTYTTLEEIAALN